MTYQPTALENAAAEPVPGADELEGGFERLVHPAPASTEEREAKIAKMLFGKDYSDYQAHATWTVDEGWHHKVIEPYGSFPMDPASAVLHYGQEIFEGLKAYRHEDGSIWTFRPTYNAARLNHSGRRLAIPDLSHEDFMASIVGLVRADSEWVPDVAGSSFYLRPFTFAAEPFLGVRAAHRYEYMVIGSPSGPYFEHGFQPINVWVEPTYHRAGPGGMGDAKTGGNYASSLLPKVKAHEEGYDEVLFLDAATDTNLDELGGMNVFVVMADGTLKTPKLTGNILPGCTRSSILQLLRSQGKTVSEETIPLQWLLDGIKSGDVAEMFACGTAAVVTSIGSLTGAGFRVEIPGSDVTKALYDHLTAIQLGQLPDTFDWLYRLA
ncbi:MAG: branched-chain amino acid aminotransferase [Ancrocorticia sp.]|uniref:branched-chain amino acid aminotransferase n=1 Tax=Ancrocorticia sp. TaxID=2593684 RepID=UPI003F91F150